MTNPALCGIPSVNRVNQVSCGTLWAGRKDSPASAPCGQDAELQVRSLPRGAVVFDTAAMQNITWQGPHCPQVKTRCGCTHHVTSQPSLASWRSASRRTVTFQGQLFHLRFASTGRYGPTTHCLPVQAMEISSHSISALRGAPSLFAPSRSASSEAESYYDLG